MKTHLVIMWLLMVACTQSQPRAPHPIESIPVELEKAITLDLSFPFEKITYTLLSNADSFLIGDVDKIKISENNLYLITSNRVLCFDIQNGSPLFHLSHQGKGPGEYLSLSDIWIDPTSRAIELLDRNGKKIQRYTSQGVWLSEIKIPTSPFAFYKFSANDYLLYHNNQISDKSDCLLIHYAASTEKIKESFFPIDKQLGNYFFVLEATNFSPNAEGGCSFFTCSSRILFRITTNWKAIPLYILDFGKNQPPEAFLQRNYIDIADFATQAAQKGYVYFITNLTENKTHLFFSFKKEQKDYWGIYTKKNKKLFIGTSIYDGIHFPDIPISLAYHNDIFALTDKAFYFLIQPFQFIEIVEKHKQKIGEKNSKNFFPLIPLYNRYTRMKTFRNNRTRF